MAVLGQHTPADRLTRAEYNQVAAMAAEAHRALPMVMYNIYYQSLEQYYAGKLSGGRKAMIFEGFLNGGFLQSTTGGATVRDNTLCLQGAGSTGTATSYSLVVEQGWKRAIAWVRYSGGSVSLSLNNIPMKTTNINTGTSPKGTNCIEMEFTLAEGDGSRTVQLVLQLSCGQSASLEVYDYGIIFL